MKGWALDLPFMRLGSDFQIQRDPCTTPIFEQINGSILRNLSLPPDLSLQAELDLRTKTATFGQQWKSAWASEPCRQLPSAFLGPHPSYMPSGQTITAIAQSRFRRWSFRRLSDWLSVVERNGRFATVRVPVDEGIVAHELPGRFYSAAVKFRLLAASGFQTDGILEDGGY